MTKKKKVSRSRKQSGLTADDATEVDDFSGIACNDCGRDDKTSHKLKGGDPILHGLVAMLCAACYGKRLYSCEKAVEDLRLLKERAAHTKPAN